MLFGLSMVLDSLKLQLIRQKIDSNTLPRPLARTGSTNKHLYVLYKTLLMSAINCHHQTQKNTSQILNEQSSYVSHKPCMMHLALNKPMKLRNR